jgi:hypothetical protein
MAQSYLIFDFGSNEEAAEQARIAIDRWKQAFRLDKKVMTRFDRSSEDGGEKAGGAEPDAAESDDAKAHRTRKHAAAKEAADKEPAQNEPAPEQITLIVRLEFSDHERLSHQRWLARIPAEEPFKHAHPQIIESGNPEFAAVVERFQGGAGRPHGFSGTQT